MLGAVLKILIMSASVVFVLAATGYDTRVDIHSGVVDAPGIGKVQIGRNKPSAAFEPTVVKPSFFDYARYLMRGGLFSHQSDTQIAGQRLDVDRNGMRIERSHRNQSPASTSVDITRVPSADSVRAEVARRRAKRETTNTRARRVTISRPNAGVLP